MRHTTLSHLSDAELLAHVDNTRDSMTETIVEIELAQRLERANRVVEELGGYAATDRIEASRELLDVLDDVGIDSADELRTRLETHAKFYALADEAGDLFQRLTELQHATL